MHFPLEEPLCLVLVIHRIIEFEVKSKEQIYILHRNIIYYLTKTLN